MWRMRFPLVWASSRASRRRLPCLCNDPPPFPQGLGRLWPAWAPTLECVSLADLSVAELDPCATLPALRACGALTSLRLLLREPMAAEVAAVDVGALPARLEQVALRNVVVTACQAARRRCGRAAGRASCAWIW